MKQPQVVVQERVVVKEAPRVNISEKYSKLRNISDVLTKISSKSSQRGSKGEHNYYDHQSHHRCIMHHEHVHHRHPHKVYQSPIWRSSVAHINAKIP